MQHRTLIRTVLVGGFLLLPHLSSAQSFRIITEDISRFWQVYGSGDTTNLAKRLEGGYLKPGTQGLKDFQTSKFNNARYLARVIKAHPNYFNNLKSQTDQIENQRVEMQKAFMKMLELYPDAKIPDVYFLVGGMNSGGTTSGAGLLIGAEMYGRTASTDTTELSAWHKAVLAGVDQVPAIVSHEMIHTLQRTDGKSLLAACIREGSADFLGELISGKQINTNVHLWAKGREAELWEQFKKDQKTNDRSLWLYNGSTVKDRPADLGYWLGYQITRGYYERSPDKKRAVKEILHMKNPEKFLEASGWEK